MMEEITIKYKLIYLYLEMYWSMMTCMKCDSIQIVCSYSSPYCMYFDHVLCSDQYDFLSFYFFYHYIDYLCVSCVAVVVCACAHGCLFVCLVCA